MADQIPAQGTPEYEAFVASKAEGVQITSYTAEGQVATPEVSTETPPERHAALPEKFNSVEDLAKAYNELQKKLSQSTPATPAADEGGDPASLEVTPPSDLPANVTQDDFSRYNTEFLEKGALSDETFTELEKKGIPRETVEAYIAGQQAIVEKRQNAGFDLVGGKAQYQQMTEWAKANMNADEIAAYNQAVNGSWELAQIAISGLQAKFSKANGSNPNLLKGEGGNESGSMAFASREEVKAAMRDPRYRADPAYRDQVAARLRVTSDSVI